MSVDFCTRRFARGPVVDAFSPFHGPWYAPICTEPVALAPLVSAATSTPRAPSASDVAFWRRLRQPSSSPSAYAARSTDVAITARPAFKFKHGWAELIQLIVLTGASAALTHC